MNRKKNLILVVDAESVTRKMIEIVADDSAFVIEECKIGKQAASLCATLKPDLVLVAFDLPDMDGVDVIVSLRSWSQVPIIALVSPEDYEEEVNALNGGADDCIAKPFNLAVLMARINARLRNKAIQIAGEPELVNGLLRMNLVRHQVYMGDTLLSLTPKEYNLLRYLLVNRGKMLTHKQILHEVWGQAHGDDAQYLRVFIGQIRNKVEKNPKQLGMITTEAGVGYRMEVAHTV